MDKKNFIEVMLDCEITRVSVVSCPDYNGGRYHKVIFDKEIDPYNGDLGNLEYLEYEGDVTDVVRKRNKEFFLDHCEPRYGEAYDTIWTLEELILNELSK